MIDPTKLREHGLAVYRDRLILDAQPPITDEQLAEVRDIIGDEVPAALLELWRVAFGGALDYDLAVQLSNGEHLNTSLAELFYPGSQHYHDLYGWIEEDEDDEGLLALPFGGFEYLERVYVMLRREPVGQVLLYAQGIPWKMRVNANTVTPIAHDVGHLFDRLSLDDDPFTNHEPYAHGRRMVEAIENVRPNDAELADQLTDLVRRAVFDWRSRVAGPYTPSPEASRAARLALHHAIDQDDPATITQLAERRWPLDLVLTASSTALPTALAQGSHAVAATLLEYGAVGADPIVFAPGTPVGLIEQCIAARCRFDASAVRSLGRTGDVEAAVLVATKGRRHGHWGDLEATIRSAAENASKTAEELRTGTRTSNVTAEEEDEKAANLRALADALPAQTLWQRLRNFRLLG